MAYEPIQRIESTVVLMDVDNIDTDQIIPARFLKATSRDADFGAKLFADWRYLEDGSTRKDFPLNSFKRESRILLAGDNFGCGSSREHAAWAIYDYGFRVVLARSFADIFRTNAFNNGLLVISLPEEIHSRLTAEIKQNPEAMIAVDLASGELTYGGGSGKYGFEINPFRSRCLQEGIDLLDFLVSRKERILEFEQKNKFYK
jgi:3-isopropylmalate/(R)-2-methylmalate dehydratase small subunit